MDPHPVLTFGIELEFVVTTLKGHEDNNEIYEAIAEIFLRNLENPLPCACVRGKWSKYRGTAYRYPDGMPLDKTDWKNYYCLSGDISVIAEPTEKAQNEREGKVAVGLELSTRVLKFDEQGFSEFNTVFAAIKDGGSVKNTKIAERLDPLLTPTAGLHVHIGLESGLDLETAKKVAILGWLLEPCLFALCNQDRGMALSNAPVRKYSLLSRVKFNENTDAPDGVGAAKEKTETLKIQEVGATKENDDTKKDDPPSSHVVREKKNASVDEGVPPSEDKLASESAQKEPMSTCENIILEDESEPIAPAPEEDAADGIPKEFSALERTWISAIFGARDMGELAELLSSTNVNFMNRRLALAIYNREDDQSTVEFRHFQSTMDENLAWKWVEIAAGFIRTASKPVSEYKEKIQRIASEYQLMKPRWKQHLRDRTFQRNTTDPWLDSWKWMLEVLDMEDHSPFWHDYVGRLPERNKTT